MQQKIMSISSEEIRHIIAHEFRTPFTGILGFSELILNNPEMIREYLPYMNEESKRLAAKLQALCDFYQLGASEVKVEACSLQWLVHHCVNTAQQNVAARRKNLEVNLRTEGLELQEYVLADKDKILTIMGHLIDNAAKFTAKGKICIEAILRKPGDNVAIQFKVSDTGIGIPEELHEDIFKPLFQGSMRLNRQYEGFGIGLAISEKLADMLGSVVTVESCVGQGSTFGVDFLLDTLPGKKPLEDMSGRPAFELVAEGGAI